MILSFNSKSILLATAIVFSGYGIVQAQSDTKEVAINFEGWVGSDQFACGESYDKVGVSETTITPTDFRLYVSNAALLDEDGNAVPIELEQDGKWQYQNTTLLDFEDGTGVCDNGTSETRTTVVGYVPQGDYEQLQFTLGVPKNLNHKDAAIAPSPLNLTSMWWNWQGGYKFLRVDLENDQVISDVANTVTVNQDQNVEDQHSNHSGDKPDIFKGNTDRHSNHQQSNSDHSDHNQAENHTAGDSHLNHGGSNKGYSVHLGSTGCKDSSQSSLFGCANPNRSQITLADFNPNKNVVIVDLAEFLATSDLNTNAANTPNGCMSAPEDGDCTAIMESLGLSTASSEQTLFWAE